MGNLLYTIAVILVIVWAIGFFVYSAGAGGITGGIIAALVGLGMLEERASLYEKGVKDGKIVMGVRPRNEEDAEYFQ